MQTRRKFLAAITGAGFMTLFPFKMAWPFTKAENEENTQIWTTADWRQIRIVDLEDNHLRNIIFFINYHGVPRRNQHLAKSAFDVDHAVDMLMRREANRRKLSWI